MAARSHSADARPGPVARARRRPPHRKPAPAVSARAPERATLAPAQAAMSLVSRCANLALTDQIEHAYAVAESARDSARAAQEITARDYPAGPAREALLAALENQRVNSERVMRAVLRFGREHGHLAFAFRYAPDSARKGHDRRAKRAAARGGTPKRASV